jgi:hypothetical protein
LLREHQGFRPSKPSSAGTSLPSPALGFKSEIAVGTDSSRDQRGESFLNWTKAVDWAAPGYGNSRCLINPPFEMGANLQKSARER